MSRVLGLGEINALDEEAFVEALGTVFEGPPWIVRAAWRHRPFRSIEHLHSEMCRVMNEAPLEQKEGLIRAHPDLVGRAALAGTLSPESTGEQASAGLDRLSPEEIARFGELNARYRERFGFPFVICARENKKEMILAGFQQRMNHSREEEIETAIREVEKISWHRLLDRVTSDAQK